MTQSFKIGDLFTDIWDDILPTSKEDWAFSTT